MDMEKRPDNIGRRGFIKALGASAALAAIGGGCGPSGGATAANRFVPTGEMAYRTDKLGNKISLLGFGMMRLPRVSRAHKESLADINDIDQDEVNRQVEYAIKHGVNFFDTSPVYVKGFSEKATGIALSRYPRSSYYLSSKLSNQRARSREESLRIYHKQFEDLQTDYIDHYFIHSVGSHENWKERYIDNGMLDFLLKEREAGRIRQLGWSFHGDGAFYEYLMKEYDWDFVMVQLNYFDWDLAVGRANMSARRQYEIAVERNVPVMIMEPLLGGRLAMPHYKVRERMMQADPAATAASWAMRFAGSLPNVFTVLSGMTFMEHLEENVCTYSPFKALDDKENAMLVDVARIMLENHNIVCTECQYCMPCPYGIDIPAVFTHFTRSMNEGNFPDDAQSPDYRRARRAYLVGLDRSVSPVRQANRCIGCRKCVPECPQRIDIPLEMQRIDKFVESLKVEV